MIVPLRVDPVTEIMNVLVYLFKTLLFFILVRILLEGFWDLLRGNKRKLQSLQFEYHRSQMSSSFCKVTISQICI